MRTENDGTQKEDKNHSPGFQFMSRGKRRAPPPESTPSPFPSLSTSERGTHFHRRASRRRPLRRLPQIASVIYAVGSITRPSMSTASGGSRDETILYFAVWGLSSRGGAALCIAEIEELLRVINRRGGKEAQQLVTRTHTQNPVRPPHEKRCDAFR